MNEIKECPNCWGYQEYENKNERIDKKRQEEGLVKAKEEPQEGKIKSLM